MEGLLMPSLASESLWVPRESGDFGSCVQTSGALGSAGFGSQAGSTGASPAPHSPPPVLKSLGFRLAPLGLSKASCILLLLLPYWSLLILLRKGICP